MLQTKTIIDKDIRRSEVDERIYSSFIEHLGRAVYEGIYEPGHPTADKDGMRQDTIALIKEIGVPAVRYPGGNFVSSYRWEDGIGPKQERPSRLDPAWRSVETNEFGIDEAVKWAEKAGTELIVAINLGTRGIEDAVNLLEYCNLDTPTEYAEMRRKNGHPEPYGIKLWCLGNEMDGIWQTGHKRAEEYARLAAETARAMKRIDPSIELVACGSSNSGMETFPEWERIVLTEAYDAVDYISMHQYYENYDDDASEFLASSIDLDRFISTVAAAADYAKAATRSDRTINISLDEWNVWYHERKKDDRKVYEEPWKTAPHLLEESYNALDALVVGSMLITIIRHSDRVKIACLAQLVNVIAPIMTEKGGKAWRQTIFYPYLHASRYGRGTVLADSTISPEYESGRYGRVPYLESVSLFTDDTGELTFFAVNRSLSESIDASLDFRGFGEMELIEHIELHCDDIYAVNTAEKENVKPVFRNDIVLSGSTARAVLRPASWNVIRFRELRQSP